MSIYHVLLLHVTLFIGVKPSSSSPILNQGVAVLTTLPHNIKVRQFMLHKKPKMVKSSLRLIWETKTAHEAYHKTTKTSTNLKQLLSKCTYPMIFSPGSGSIELIFLIYSLKSYILDVNLVVELYFWGIRKLFFISISISIFHTTASKIV